MDRALSIPLDVAPGRLVCRACGYAHAPVALAPGDSACCVRCGTLLATGTRHGLDAALAYALGGAILAFPAALLPFVTVAKLAQERVGLLFTSVSALWFEGMRLLAVWVLFCGALAPFILLGTLAAVTLPLRFGRRPGSRRLVAFAHALSHWAMPEVQVLAVLVALVKLRTLVGIEIGPGFWCYIAVSLLTLAAWRSFDVKTLPSLSAA